MVDVRSGKTLRSDGATITARPGSAIKPFVLAALLEARILPVKPDFFCPGKLVIGGRSFACTHPAVHRAIDADLALAYSCNNFFAHYASQLKRGMLEHTLARYGLHADEARTPDARALLALGEEGISVTPRQLLEAYRKLAETPDTRIVQGLRDCVRFGTGQLAAVSDLSVAGKTGTSTLAGKHGSYAWFAGFAPAEAPEVAFLAMARQGSGGVEAAPLAREMLLKWKGRDNEIAVQTRNGLRTLPLDEYVTGVLGGEASGMASAEALKALAIAARTYAVRFRGRHRDEGFDFCDRAHCQSFHPESANEKIRAAVDATSGELLWYKGSPAATYYSQDCGGVTEAARFVWPELDVSYLGQREDPNCPREQWTANLTTADIARALRDSSLKAPAKLASRVIERSPSGRALRLDLGGGDTISASTLRFAVGRSLGWSKLRSDLYTVHAAGEGLMFEGRGTGHGVGLCQHGAERMRGTHREILSFYYPGTVLGLSASGIQWQALSGEHVELRSTAPSRDRDLIGIAEKLLTEAESTTGLRLLFRPQIRVYPTVAIFRNATGEPGWVAASTRGRVIRVQPAGANRDVLRHEIFHLLIESHASAALPWWFREGLALSLAGGPQPSAATYSDARKRVDECMRRYGKTAVLGWLTAGLPPELKNTSASHPATAAQ